MRKPKLLEQLRNALRIKYFNRRTEKAYLYWIKRFILFKGSAHSFPNFALKKWGIER
ncbi:phage integrase N-terminal SAM-like domain-containing protein [Acidobacteria bacterium AH-259-L09]|nr:phage integrase N-terminal SAM-like domain-containing protein [Acidobacteria bacterium AH-259-L09]